MYTKKQRCNRTDIEQVLFIERQKKFWSKDLVDENPFSHRVIHQGYRFISFQGSLIMSRQQFSYNKIEYICKLKKKC